MFEGIDHVEIVVPLDEFDRHIGFFSDVFGFEIKSRREKTPPDSPIEKILYMELNGSLIELMSVEDPDEITSGPFQVGYRTIAIEVDDMNEATDYFKEKGIEIVQGPKTVGESKRAEIMTPGGLPIELREWR